MHNYEGIYDRLGETLQAFSPYYHEGMIKHLQENGAPAIWFPLARVRASEPETFYLDPDARITPYMALARQREGYGTLAADGYLEALGNDRYRLTEKGRRTIEGLYQIAHEELATVSALPDDDLAKLAQLLQALVDSALASPEPAAKLSLLASRWADPGPDAAAQARIDQYVTDLISYRDDAHIAAWRPTGVDGKTWETLTLLWRDEATSLPEISDRLSGRGHTTADYAGAMQALAQRGWVEADGDRFRITEEGKRIRQEAEQETDRLFYIGWSTLTQDELATLDRLLARLNEGLHAGAERLCWSQTRGLGQAIFPVTRDAVNETFGDYFDSPRAFFPTLMAFGAHPRPLTVADYRRRFPYTKPNRALELLGQAESSGCLSRDGDAFMLTGKGREAIVQVNDVFYKALAEIDPLPETESAELAGLLANVVEATLAADEPEGKWALTNIRGCHPEEDYGPLARIDQAIDDLNGFRDDVHIAAWKSHGVSGRDWDALTLVWRGEASSAETLAETLAPKGHTPAEYAQSLQALADRGWLQESVDGYQITVLGRQVRADAEETTDRYFYGPWQTLDNGQLLRLHALLTQMKLALLALAAE